MKETSTKRSFNSKEMYQAAVRNSDNADLSAVEGLVTKFARHGFLCCTKEVEHERWFVVDPKEATLSYWMPDQRQGPPRKVFQLRNLKLMERNETQLVVTLYFRSSWRCLLLQWETEAEYARFMDTLNYYDLAWLAKHPEAIKAREADPFDTRESEQTEATSKVSTGGADSTPWLNTSMAPTSSDAPKAPAAARNGLEDGEIREKERDEWVEMGPTGSDDGPAMEVRMSRL